VTDLPPLPTLGQTFRRPPPGGARRIWMRTTVLEIVQETPRMRSIRLRLPEAHRHTPGQHVAVRLVADDGYTASRDYSIASAPGDGTEYELLVERLDDGEVSTFLHDGLRVGDELEVRSPGGGWFVWNGRHPALLVGGGSGVAPLMSMLRHARSTATASAHLVVSVRTLTDLPYRDELLGHDDVTVVLTREAPDGWPLPPGRLAAQVLEPLLAETSTAYVCGSNGFAEHASQLLVALGQPTGSVRVERFGS
jgi:ferredoxin-NADP reductase